MIHRQPSVGESAMHEAERCALCSADLAPILAESGYWRLALNRNQNLLGKCFWALRRHAEGVPELSMAEWLDLHQQLAYTARALALAFAPDHFNYAFLQNQDRHAHCHVIARYASVRTFAGLSFEDPDYPDHYAVPAPARHLTPAVMAVLAQDLRARFVEASADG
jgi:diadenosine tetraphosphate (Ap4A) HIT family hydrolase